MLAAFLLSLALQAEAPAEPPSPEVFTDPSGAAWVSQPTQAQFARAYPAQAEWNATPGRAVLGCVFTAEGRLTDCKVVSEDPKGQRFGAAALKLAPYFRAVAKPAGTSLEGESITLPVVFEIYEHH